MTTTEETPGYEVLGAVQRVLPCAVSDADRRQLDEGTHALLERKKAVIGQRLRVRAAATKIRERLAALEEEIGDLHEKRKLVEVERTIRCEVRRTATEVLTVRGDTGATIARRALTKEEHEALHPRLAGTGPAPKVHAEELDLDDATKRRAEAEAEHQAKLAELLQDFDLDAALSGATATPDEEPKKGRKGKAKAEGEAAAPKKGKGKKKPEQTEIPGAVITPAPTNGAAS